MEDSGYNETMPIKSFKQGSILEESLLSSQQRPDCFHIWQSLPIAIVVGAALKLN